MFLTELLATVVRSGRPESEHRGAVAVADASGNLVAWAGDPHLETYLRSSAKPFQALAVVSSGAADRFGFSDSEVAVMAGSHSGSPSHVKTVESILSKIKLPLTALHCGVHAPTDPESAEKLRQSGQAPTVLHNNCSGKHAGMLALAVDMGQSTDDYLENDHPVQISIREGLGEITGLKESDISIGIDGCSAPTFSIPLARAAVAFAKLALTPEREAVPQPSHPSMKSIVGAGRTWSRSDALAKVAQAMRAHPEMVAGAGRLDTEIMKAFPGWVVAKGGAEGFQGVGLYGKNGQPALGVAIKIADGNGKRAVPPVLMDVLGQLRRLDGAALAKTKEALCPKEKNLSGIIVGETISNLKLRWA